MDYSIFIDMAVSVILKVLKSPQDKPKVKKIMVKIFSSIKAAYPNDPDFQ
jgi:hypothetical protein